MKALVTGASRGIGLAICEELASQGISVLGVSRNVDETTKQRFINKAGAASELIALDITNSKAVDNFFNENFIDKEMPSILVNNAGVAVDVMFHKMTLEQWKIVIDTNLSSYFSITQPIYKAMMKAGYGRIVNISSINGQKGQLGQTNYSASKAGVHGFTMALAREGAKHNITVNTISPGYTATEMVAAIPQDIQNVISNEIPMKRFAEVEEIARCVTYLIGDGGNYITGENISINGGLLIK